MQSQALVASLGIDDKGTVRFILLRLHGVTQGEDTAGILISSVRHL